MVVNPTYQQPILNRFIAMKPKEQINFLNELLAEKDGPSLAAILDAPKAATGLAKDHANRMWEAYTKAAAPEATAALSEYNNIQDAVQAPPAIDPLVDKVIDESLKIYIESFDLPRM